MLEAGNMTGFRRRDADSRKSMAAIHFTMLLDTTAEAARIRWAVLMAMTGESRLRQALEITDLVLRIAADGRRASAPSEPRQAHPETTEPADS
jgi:hypothetical protein